MTGKVIGAAIEVHRALGPGLLESIYHECLRRELRIREIPFESQRSVPIIYKGTQLHSRLRLDLLINSTLIVEVKAIDGLQGHGPRAKGRWPSRPPETRHQAHHQLRDLIGKLRVSAVKKIAKVAENAEFSTKHQSLNPALDLLLSAVCTRSFDNTMPATADPRASR